MAQRIPAGLSRAEARKFGIVVGSAFAILTAVLWWRGHGAAMYVTAALATGLIVFGIVAPTLLRPVYRIWMAFALQLSKITTPIFMALVYFLVLLPVGILRRTFGRNPIVNVEHNASYWTAREPSQRRSDLQRQF